MQAGSIFASLKVFELDWSLESRLILAQKTDKKRRNTTSAGWSYNRKPRGLTVFRSVFLAIHSFEWLSVSSDSAKVVVFIEVLYSAKLMANICLTRTVNNRVRPSPSPPPASCKSKTASWKFNQPYEMHCGPDYLLSHFASKPVVGQKQKQICGLQKLRLSLIWPSRGAPTQKKVDSASKLIFKQVVDAVATAAGFPAFITASNLIPYLYILFASEWLLMVNNCYSSS